MKKTVLTNFNKQVLTDKNNWVSLELYDCPLLSAMVGAWELDELTGTIVYDSLGVNNGQYTGMTINQTGLLDKAYYISSGTSSKIQFSNSIFTGFPFSASYWFNLSKLGINTLLNTNYILSAGNFSRCGVDIVIDTKNDKSINCYVPDQNLANFTNIFKHPIGTLNLNQWHNVIYTINSDFDLLEHNAYLNGVLITGTTTTIYFTGVAMNFVSGVTRFLTASNPTNGANMLADQIMVFDKILDAAEVATIYNNGIGIRSTHICEP